MMSITYAARRRQLDRIIAARAEANRAQNTVRGIVQSYDNRQVNREIQGLTSRPILSYTF
jgi:hypothetical protein